MSCKELRTEDLLIISLVPSSQPASFEGGKVIEMLSLVLLQTWPPTVFLA